MYEYETDSELIAINVSRVNYASHRKHCNTVILTFDQHNDCKLAFNSKALALKAYAEIQRMIKAG